MSYIPKLIADTAPALIGLAEQCKVVDHGTCEAAGAVRGSLHSLRKQIEKLRKENKQPHLDAGKAVDAEAKVITKPLDEAVAALDSQLTAYNAAVQLERQRAEMAEAEARVQQEQAVQHTNLPPDLTQTHVEKPDAAPIKMRKYKELEIYDEQQIPREYLIVDEVAVRRAIENGAIVAGARIITKERPA